MARHWVFACIVAGWALIGPLPAPGQQGPGEGISRQQADAILNELKEMRALLEKLVSIQAAAKPGSPAPPPVVSLKIVPDSMMLGDKNAPYTMVEYIDLQCPFCKRYDETTFAQIRKNLIETGKLRYYSRDFPLVEMHPFAMKAAVATHCAAEQGQFWPMREALVAHADNLSVDAIQGYAKKASLDSAAFNACLAGSKYDETIRASVNEGAAIGVQGTPSFLLGKSTAEGVTGSIVVGALPYIMIEAELKKLEAKEP